MKGKFGRNAKVTIILASFLTSLFQVSYGTGYCSSSNESETMGDSLVDSCSQTQYSASSFDFAPIGSRILTVRNSMLENVQTKGSGGGAGDIISSEKFGFFLSGQTINTDRKRTSNENGYDAESAEFIVGADYRIKEQLVIGLAISYADNENDYDRSSGKIDTESVSTTVYGLFSPIDNMQINSYIGWSGLDIDGHRNISSNQRTNMSTEGDKITAGISALYDFNFRGFSVSPEVAIDYSDTWIDKFTEKGVPNENLIVRDQAIHSFISKVGINASYAWSQSWGVIIPHFRFFHIHEYNNDSRTVHSSRVIAQNNGGFKTDSPDRDYFTIAGGVSTVLPHGIQLFIDYENTLDHSFIDRFNVNGGVRFAF